MEVQTNTMTRTLPVLLVAITTIATSTSAQATGRRSAENPLRASTAIAAAAHARQPNGRRPLPRDARAHATTPQSATEWDERTLELPFVGRSVAYVPKTKASGVVLFISGDGGWNLGVVDMARRLASHLVVIGVSLPALRRDAVENPDTCWYPAGDLEELSHAAQRLLNIPEYHPPILVGYSSGATLVYAALAAAPPGTFAGAVSLGFCRDLDVRREVCPDDRWRPEYDAKKGVNWLPPQPKLRADWYVIHGVQDQVCSPAEVDTFVKSTGRGHLTLAEKTGHGFGRPAQWGQAFDEAVTALVRAAAIPERVVPAPASMQQIEGELDKLGLPLEFRWPGEPTAFVLFLSGDGGWASLDQTIAEHLASKGIGVVGLNSLRYFWKSKPPEQVAADLRRIVSVLVTRQKPVYIGGYSFGAEAGTLALARGDPTLRSEVAGLLLIAPGSSASFEIDPLDWIRSPKNDPAARVAPAVAEMNLPTLCVAGEEDEDTACRQMRAGEHTEIVRLPGSHHFKGDYEAVGRALDAFITARGRPRS